MVVKKYLPQTQEIIDVIESLVSAGIPNYMYDKLSSAFRDKVVK